MDIFERRESVVRSYSRTWPTVFKTARGYHLYNEEGKEYIDFFAGAGTLNYGHNHPEMKKRLIEYLNEDGIIHALDTMTVAKRAFLERFEEVILKPRNLDYKVQFPGPTGTNAVESALKLARKVTGREKVVGFTNGFHGMTLGALAVTGNMFKRDGAGVGLGLGVSMPYDGFLGDDTDTIDYLRAFLENDGSGLDQPAAVIVETLQGEGGVNVASVEWMERLSDLCKEQGVLLILDDIQAGCGRTGPFFSFEGTRIDPDIICLSKSLSGFGLPMAVTLMKPEHDIWDPGEHNGTFRGNNAAFVTAVEALKYWETDTLSKTVMENAAIVTGALDDLVARYPGAELVQKGKGLLQGLKSDVEEFSNEVVKEAFSRGLIIETSGPNSEVVKIMPPLVIDAAGLKKGLKILADSVDAVAKARRLAGEPAMASA